MNPQVDAFLERADQWRKEFEALRTILLASGLVEELKWGQPCYSLEGKNVALMHGFKAYCAVLFHKGSLLEDPGGLLIQQTPRVQAARQLRFTSVADIARQKKALTAFLARAIEVEREGKKVAFKKTEEFDVPGEFAAALAKSAKLKAAFSALTPGRQRAYLFHFAQPKQARTRVSRVEKHAPRILKGLGLDDE
jgi:uncharacterized protein YdeI (YjbR/CyaY-like superfamily)